MSKITFLAGGQEYVIDARDGSNLLDLAKEANIAIDAPCSGNGVCGKCKIRLAEGTLDAPKHNKVNDEEYEQGIRLACCSKINGDAVIDVPDIASAYRSRMKTADLSSGEELKMFNDTQKKIADAGITFDSEEGIGIAIDIGTTTVTLVVVDLKDGRIIGKGSSGNGQIRYGADVINRLIEQDKEGGVKKLQDAVIEETINPIIDVIFMENKLDPADVKKVVVAGNTTMNHLFLGIPANSIRLEPYVPVFLERSGDKAGDVGLDVNPEAEIIIAPNVGSYVGGDITAGALASMVWNSPEMAVFVDLGTNGEIVFGNEDFLMCCACSAGPAFEGGNIDCGMRATDGAIESCEFTEEGEFKMSVIGDVKPIGLCGSGIIELVGSMYERGIIDARGKIIANDWRVLEDKYGLKSYILVKAEDAATPGDIVISEVDIDNFIKAKGAIYSGIKTMVDSLELPMECVEKVYIAGGIGSGIDIESSIKIGMLPKLELDCFQYIGNTSLTGAYAMLTSKEAKEKVDELGNSMTYMELSSTPSYMDEFVAACFIPHTDKSLFE